MSDGRRAANGRLEEKKTAKRKTQRGQREMGGAAEGLATTDP
jgi:hypothetical protein